MDRIDDGINARIDDMYDGCENEEVIERMKEQLKEQALLIENLEWQMEILVRERSENRNQLIRYYQVCRIPRNQPTLYEFIKGKGKGNK